jgi:beta-barrel assembly-enhancing protease
MSRRGWVWALVLLGVGGCSLLPKDLARRLNKSVPVSTNVNALGADAAKLAEQQKKCERFRKLQVAYEEEEALGGTVALNWVGEGGGLFIDPPKDPSPLRRGEKEAQLPATPRNGLHTYLNQVGRNLGFQSPRPAIKWTFGVLESPNVGAISAPGGYVLLTRGLLQRIRNEAQLAGVLAHEIAHVVHRDHLESYKEAKVTSCQAAFGAQLVSQGAKSLAKTSIPLGDVGKLPGVKDAFSAALGSDSGNLSLAGAESVELLTKLTELVIDKLRSTPLSQDQETAADKLAVDLMLSAGYDPREFIAFLKTLPGEGGFLAHHPSHAQRVSTLEAHLRSKKAAPGEFSEGELTPAHQVVPLTDELVAIK